MKGVLRRVRGAMGMGLVWAAAWFGAGMTMMLGFLVTTGGTGADVPYPIGFAAIGFFAGVTFSGVVGLLEGRRTFDEMSLPRFATWGGVGGLLFSLVFVSVMALGGEPDFIRNLWVLGPTFAVAGAGCASGTLALARRADTQPMVEPGATDAPIPHRPREATRGVLRTPGR